MSTSTTLLHLPLAARTTAAPVPPSELSTAALRDYEDQLANDLQIRFFQIDTDLRRLAAVRGELLRRELLAGMRADFEVLTAEASHPVLLPAFVA